LTSTSAALVEGGADAAFMRQALGHARRALGGVAPRAPVGAVVVADGRVAGEGATEPRPGDHAEVVALKRAGARARGATLYCTLEPHAHHGTVPPCTDAIIEAGIQRVVCAIADPNPKVDGAGFRQLREAGVDVATDVPEAIISEAVEIIECFEKHLRTGRPFVTAKYAMTIDGKVATRTGTSRWITGESARRRAHQLRAEADAVVVGIGTVLADDPRLTARLPWADTLASPRPRLRVVVDSHGRLPTGAALLAEPGNVLHVTASAPGPVRATASGTARGTTRGTADGSAPIETLALPAPGGAVDLPGLIDELGRRGCAGVLVEGGPRLLGSLFDAGLVDKVVSFVAPRVFGGEGAPGPVGGRGVDSPAHAVMLGRVRTEAVGDDLIVVGYVE
jgi:diaminohydroxyphosphoribosylaminopyrimidine deaminase/5-amino-6-(5-phosphoribosylamino)uracil reductase